MASKKERLDGTARGQSGWIQSHEQGASNLQASGPAQPPEIVLLDDLSLAYPGDDCPFESEETPLESVEVVLEKPAAPPPQESVWRGVQRPVWLIGGTAVVTALALVLVSGRFRNQIIERPVPVTPAEQGSTAAGVATDMPSRSSDPGRTADLENDKKSAGSTTPGPGNRASPQGTLIIDAVPWGTVVDVRDSRGTRITLGNQRYTPLALSLPSDVYTITIEDPSLTVSRNLKATVVQSQQTTATATFKKVDALDYFREAGLQEIQ